MLELNLLCLHMMKLFIQLEDGIYSKEEDKILGPPFKMDLELS